MGCDAAFYPWSCLARYPWCLEIPLFFVMQKLNLSVLLVALIYLFLSFFVHVTRKAAGLTNFGKRALPELHTHLLANPCHNLSEHFDSPKALSEGFSPIIR